MKPIAGLILRRAGLLIELACLMAFVAVRDRRWAAAGVNLKQALIAGVVLGFILWVAGMAALRRSARQSGP